MAGKEEVGRSTFYDSRSQFKFYRDHREAEKEPTSRHVTCFELAQDLLNKSFRKKKFFIAPKKIKIQRDPTTDKEKCVR